ncbi:MAG: GTPase HflX [candidate division WOR-3 bacterium]
MERVILVGLARNPKDRWRKVDSLFELEALTKTAGGEVVGKFLQIKEKPSSRTLLGEGKIIELRQLCQKHQCQLLIFDEILSPSQIRNIKQETGVDVIDRRALILDIFALHARTAEAALQVEMAQLEYRLSMLTGKGITLSRLGGGIGTRGPGEKKLEEDRRRIRARISTLKKSLKEIDKERRMQRENRSNFFRISLCGYTNAGKSTLLNKLTNAEVKVAPELFSTLDPKTKVLEIEKNIKVLLTDTVGFIRDLPPQLLASFKVTLDEIKESDLILHIIDATSEDLEEKIKVVEKTLEEIGALKSIEDATIVNGQRKEGPRHFEKSIVRVFNKTDILFERFSLERLKKNYPTSVFISALTGEGIKDLLRKIKEEMRPLIKTQQFTIPVSRGDILSRIYEIGHVLSFTEVNGKYRLMVRGYAHSLNRLRKEIKRSSEYPKI